jgi:hypothetical protein
VFGEGKKRFQGMESFSVKQICISSVNDMPRLPLLFHGWIAGWLGGRMV